MREPIIKGNQPDDAGENNEPTPPVTRQARNIDPVDEKLRPQSLGEIVGQRASPTGWQLPWWPHASAESPCPTSCLTALPAWARRPSPPCFTTSWGSSST